MKAFQGRLQGWSRPGIRCGPRLHAAARGDRRALIRSWLGRSSRQRSQRTPLQLKRATLCVLMHPDRTKKNDCH